MSNKKIKILFVLPMFSVGGAERILFDILKKINKDEFEIFLVCLRGASTEYDLWRREIEREGFVIKIVDQDKKFGRIKRFFLLYRFIKRIKPDIVQTQLLSADILGVLAAKLAGIKITIIVEHNVVVVKGFLKKILKIIIAHFATKTIAVANAVEAAVRRDLKIKNAKTMVIYNGIETADFIQANKDYAAQNRPIIIGVIGRLTEQKGYGYLLEALHLIKDENFLCYIAGNDDPNKKRIVEELKNKVKTLQLEEKVKFLGLVEDRFSFYKKLDVFVMSSLWEGFPIVLLEAGASGLPAVASEVGGIRELIKNNFNGFLFKKKDTNSLANYLKILINDSRKREELGTALSREVLTKYDLNITVGKYEEVYKNLLNS